MCWEQLLLHFTLPNGEGIHEKVKHYAFKKVAIAFQVSKENLKKDFVKKGSQPDFETKYQKLRPHWDSFVQYVETTSGLQKVAHNKENASHKVHFHNLGQGGYIYHYL